MRNRNKFAKDEKSGLMIKKPHNPLVMIDGKAAPKCKAEVLTFGNLWGRKLTLNKGESKAGHKHEFDHLHHLIKGKVEIRVYDTTREDEPILVKEYDATEDDKWIKVPKEHFHDIIALEDNTVGYCIQAIRNDKKEVVDTNFAYDQDWMDEVAAFEAAKGQPDETAKKPAAKKKAAAKKK